MRLPGPWMLGSIGLALGAAVIPLVLYGGHLYYLDGGRSPDAPGMLLASVMMTAPAWLGGWLAFCALFLVGYRGGARWRPFWGDSFPSMLLALVATAATAFFLWLLVAQVDVWRLSRLPFAAHLIGCAAYCQALRAAAVARSRSR